MGLAAQYKEKKVELTSWELEQRAKKRAAREAGKSGENNVQEEQEYEVEEEDELEREERDRKRIIMEEKRRKRDLQREREEIERRKKERGEKRRLLEEIEEQTNMTHMERLEKAMSSHVREGIKDILLDGLEPHKSSQP